MRALPPRERRADFLFPVAAPDSGLAGALHSEIRMRLFVQAPESWQHYPGQLVIQLPGGDKSSLTDIRRRKKRQRIFQKQDQMAG